MKFKGYTGKILYVDLSKRTIETRSVSEAIAEDYIGGVGLATKIIADGAQNWQDPFAAGNPLIIMNGPITGTIIPWSGRHCVAALSPLTGMFGEAYAGGMFARELKRAGYDGIVVTGTSDRLVYLRVQDDAVSIEDAAPFAGVDTYALEGLLRRECGQTAKVLCIGMAGEKQVKFASVMNDGPAGRAAARCGLGAVMGAKNLKAIVVTGSKEVSIAGRDRLMQSIRNALPKIITDPAHRLKKEQFIYGHFIDSGRNSVHNWRDGVLEGFKEAVLKETERHVHNAKTFHCAGCPSGCVESHVGTEGRLLHWESFAPLGSQCGIIDMGYVQRAFTLCNRHGIDSISAGGVISFAMECFEEGLIGLNDTDGFELRFGSGDALLAMLDKICNREGFGAVLAEGVRGAARLIGKGAEQYAIETKGLEVPAHDPRSLNYLALSYATANRGACHCETNDPQLEKDIYKDPLNFPFSVEGMAEKVVRGQNFAGIVNSLTMCFFCTKGKGLSSTPESYMGLSVDDIIEWFNLATGMERDYASLMHSGEKIYNLKHLINLKCGYVPSSDTLHERFTTVKRKPGPCADHLPPIHQLVSDYYCVRGWNEDGTIKEATLNKLGLKALYSAAAS